MTAATDKNLSLTFSAIGGDTGITAGARKTIRVALDNAPTDNYNYYVELDGVGGAFLNGTTAVELGVIDVDSNVSYDLEDVTVTAYPKLQVVAAKWSDYELTVFFNRPVASYDGDNTFDYTYDFTYTEAATADGVAYDFVSGVGTDKVTITFKNYPLEAGDSVNLGSSIQDAETGLSGNTLGSLVTLTLKANGVVNGGGISDLPTAP